MANNPNTATIQQIWSRKYQYSHYVQPVYRAFCTERGENELKMGDTWYRTGAGDFLVNNMGGNGSYVTQPTVDTSESLVVNIKKEVSFQIPYWQKIQFHLPEIMEYTDKATYRVWNNVDASLLQTMTQSAAQYVDDGSLGGTAGNPLTVTPDNVQALYSAVEVALMLANVKYIPGKQFTGNYAKDNKGGRISNCAISPILYSMVNQYVGSKNSALGDRVTTNGYVGHFMGFNNFVSNNLMFEAQITISVNPTDGDTITFLSGVSTLQYGVSTSQAFVITFKNTISTTVGNIKIASTAALTLTNLVAVLNAPLVSIPTGTNAGWNAPTLSTSQTLYTQNYFLTQVSAQLLSGSTTIAQVFVAGFSNFPLSSAFTSGSNSWSKQIQHNLFGTSMSIDLLMQKRPSIFENPVSAQVARDYVMWNLWGSKVFNDQALQLVDVRINAASFTAAQTPLVVTA